MDSDTLVEYSFGQILEIFRFIKKKSHTSLCSLRFKDPYYFIKKCVHKIERDYQVV